MDANCGLADGSGCVIASGGVGGYTYLWPTGGTGSCEAGLAASSYLVTVTDANSCVAQIVVEVSDLLGPVASIVSQTEVSCNGLTDGSATVDMTGGGGSSFTVQWDANAGSQTTPTASNLGAGVYTVTITDDLGCSASTSATITEPSAIATNPGFVDPACFGYCDGSMGVVVSGGTPAYGYEWFDASARRFWFGDVKWQIWLRPVFNWLVLAFLGYLVLMAFNTLIFRQWAHNEKLIYPLAEIDNPREMEFVNASGRDLDTIHPIDLRFFEDIAILVNEEHPEAIDGEMAGVLGEIGNTG